MFDGTFCCLVRAHIYAHTYHPPSCLVTGCALAVPLGCVGSLCVSVCVLVGEGSSPDANPPPMYTHPQTHIHLYTPLSSQSYRWCAVQLHFHHCDDECSCQTPGNQSHICSCRCRHGDTAEVCTTTSTRPGGNDGWHRKRARERETVSLQR